MTDDTIATSCSPSEEEAIQIFPFDETKSKNGNSFAKCCVAMYQPLETTTMATSNPTSTFLATTIPATTAQ